MIDNGLKKLLSAKEVVWQMMEDLGIDLSQDAAMYEGMFSRWVFHANLEMGAPANFETKQYEAVIKDRQVLKPCGYVRLGLARIGEKCPLIPRFEPILPTHGRKRSYGNKVGRWGNWHCQCSNFNPRFYNHNYIIQEAVHYFNFSDNCEGQLFYMDYTAYLFGEDGYPLVDETFYEALTAYCRWKYIIRDITTGSKKFSQGDEAIAKANWQEFARKSYGKSIMESLSEDMVEQMMANFNDTMRVNTNPYTRNNLNQNLNHNHNGLLSRPVAIYPNGRI